MSGASGVPHRSNLVQVPLLVREVTNIPGTAPAHTSHRWDTRPTTTSTRSSTAPGWRSTRSPSSAPARTTSRSATSSRAPSTDRGDRLAQRRDDGRAHRLHRPQLAHQRAAPEPDAPACGRSSTTSSTRHTGSPTRCHDQAARRRQVQRLLSRLCGLASPTSDDAPIPHTSKPGTLGRSRQSDVEV